MRGMKDGIRDVNSELLKQLARSPRKPPSVVIKAQI